MSMRYWWKHPLERRRVRDLPRMPNDFDDVPTHLPPSIFRPPPVQASPIIEPDPRDASAFTEDPASARLSASVGTPATSVPSAPPEGPEGNGRLVNDDDRVLVRRDDLGVLLAATVGEGVRDGADLNEMGPRVRRLFLAVLTPGQP